MKDIDGNNAGDETNQTGEQNQPPVVFTGKAGKNAEHANRLRLFAPTNARTNKFHPTNVLTTCAGMVIKS